MYVTENKMHPELAAIMAGQDPALGPQERRVNYIFQLDKLRGCWRETVSEELVQQARDNAIVLWPDGAPGAAGSRPADIPLLYPVLPGPERTTGMQDAARPAVIVCPGGGFRFHAPWEALPFAEWFQERGFAAFVLQYRLLPYIMPAMLDDGRRAVRTLRAYAGEFGIDPNRIAMIGFSAGGYVTAQVATHFDAGDPQAGDPVERESSRPDAAILFYSATDIHTRPRLALLRLNDPAPDPALARRYSASPHVSEDTPPAFLYGLRTDQIVPSSQLLGYVQACERHDVPFELHMYGRGVHGAGVAFSDPELNWQEPLTNWLNDLGFLD